MATAALLARRGFITFAGVRSEADAARVAARDPNIRPVMLDVTDAASIAAAATTVARAQVPLAGVVGNAGYALAGPLEHLPIDELRRQFEVNVVGACAVAQAMLPLLRPSGGRVIFVGSISGRFAVPFIAPYSASKFALRALADAWRIELGPAGVDVILIEPGSVQTPIWQKGRDANAALFERLPPQAQERYRSAMDAVLQASENEARTAIAPERVASAILRALTAKRPRPRYLVGAGARAGSVLALLPPHLSGAILRRRMRLP